MALFSEDTAVISLGATLIVPLILYQLGDATQITFANALRGTSKVMPMLWIAFVSYVTVGLPATYLLAFTAGLSTYGIILSFFRVAVSQPERCSCFSFCGNARQNVSVRAKP